MFAIVVLGANASYASLEMNSTLFVDGFRVWPVARVDVFAGFNLAVAILTLISMKPM